VKIRQGFVSNSSSSSFVAFGVGRDQVKFGDDKYLELFNDRLEFLADSKKDKNGYWYKYNLQEYQDMCLITEDLDKVEYAKEHLEIDFYEFEDRGIECGGQENDFVGITLEWLMKYEPDMRFSEIKAFVAEKLNDAFDMELEPKDIGYVEEGWYDG
jgi:hypothetical protein